MSQAAEGLTAFRGLRARDSDGFPTMAPVSEQLPAPDWYLKEWMHHFGKRQADLIRELGWSRNKASLVWNGQDYRRDIVNELSAWLSLAPYELLMRPGDALALRGLRDYTLSLAAEHGRPFAGSPSVAKRSK